MAGLTGITANRDSTSSRKTSLVVLTGIRLFFISHDSSYRVTTEMAKPSCLRAAAVALIAFCDSIVGPLLSASQITAHVSSRTTGPYKAI
jgi:hypothetical protein